MTQEATEAEKVMMGEMPELTEEDQAKMTEMFAKLEKEETIETDLRDTFTVGEKIQDHTHGMTMVIRSVGKRAMNLQALGNKWRFVAGHEVTLAGHVLKIIRARKNEATFELMESLLEAPSEEAGS